MRCRSSGRAGRWGVIAANDRRRDERGGDLCIRAGAWGEGGSVAEGREEEVQAASGVRGHEYRGLDWLG